MSLKKRFKKAVSKIPAVKMFKTVKGMFGKGSSGDDGLRGEAAGRLVNKDISKQAGGGQIKFTTQEWEEPT